MARRRRQLLGLAVAILLVVCGQGSSDSSTIRLKSPAVEADGLISAHYRCGAGTIWLPLRWGAIPSDTKELALYFGQFKREPAKGHRVNVLFGALIPNINPIEHEIPVNTLPPGAGFTYYKPFHSCTQTREGQRILVELFALPRKGQGAYESLKEGFLARLTEEALGMRRNEPPTSLGADALAVGKFIATYGPTGR